MHSLSIEKEGIDCHTKKYTVLKWENKILKGEESDVKEISWI